MYITRRLGYDFVLKALSPMRRRLWHVHWQVQTDALAHLDFLRSGEDALICQKIQSPEFVVWTIEPPGRVWRISGTKWKRRERWTAHGAGRHEGKMRYLVPSW